jgi:hypothetical protein
MKNKPILLIILLLVFSSGINAFPGDHAGLTCTETATLPGFGYKKDYFADNPNDCIPGSLCAALIDTDSAVRESAHQYVIDNRSAIQNQVRMYHDTEYHVTVWGDSLSDLINFYGVTTPEYWDQRGFKYKYGNHGGDHFFIDSFEDYILSGLRRFADLFENDGRVEFIGY